jgi:thiamine-monophosphate kinase
VSEPSSSEQALGEFDLISRYFAPLAGPEGLHLSDDAALLRPTPGYDLVFTADALVADVHFRASDPPDLIARKSLRVNLSDLAAKGADPLGYLLTIAWPRGTSQSVVAAFADGLAADQAEFGIKLWGGDTVVSHGPLCVSITAIGQVPQGQMITRAGARPGDLIFVTGTLGDGALGLDYPDVPALALRYLLPQPRLGIGAKLRGVASAGLDISDGLLADGGHLARASAVALELDMDRLPLSVDAERLLSDDPSLWARILSGGDDYELLFTVPADRRAIAEAVGAEIGRVVAGAGVQLQRAGQPIEVTDSHSDISGLGSGGWQHKLGS